MTNVVLNSHIISLDDFKGRGAAVLQEDKTLTEKFKTICIELYTKTDEVVIDGMGKRKIQ
jgi:hypothetical protein